MEHQHRAPSNEKHKHSIAPAQRKFVSMFRVDGAPILPPLMTTEKRRQMAKIKEKSIKLERKWEEKQRKKLQFRENLEEVLGEPQQADTPRSQRSSNGSSCSSGSASASVTGGISQRSYELEVAAARQQHQLEEESYKLLSSLMYRRDEVSPAKNVFAESSTSSCTMANNSEPQSSHRNLVERMQKLQKSETIIYDNRFNTVILPNLEENPSQNIQLECQQQQDQVRTEKRAADYFDAEEELHTEFLDAQKSVQLSLDRSAKQIPSIYVNPPTPLVDTRTFCDATVESASAEIFNSRVPPTKNDIPCSFDLSSEDSFECFESSQSTPPKAYDLRIQEKITNIPAKLKSRSALTLCEIKPPQRAATSPQLKRSSILKNSTPTNCLDVFNSSATTNPLVRSNSFTLDCPSKALLEHIRKQNEAANVPSQRRVSPSARAIRDTVESKAKRVQKVVPKTRPFTSSRSQTKITTNAANNSPYLANSTTALFKNKRSPYELKTSSKTKLGGRPSKKTLPNSVTPKQLSPKNSLATTSAASKNKENAQNHLFDSKQLNEIELKHRQKFLQLIAQQQEEQNRMQLTFEAQQQQLLQQLSADMSKTHLHAQSHSQPQFPTTSLHATPSARTFDVDGMSVDIAPDTKSEWSDLKSPTLSVGSSILSATINAAGGDLPSPETSTCSIVTSMAFSSSHRTPRRRLFPHEHSSAAQSSVQGGISIDGGGGDGASLISATTTSSSASRRFQQHLKNERRITAATKINACARGFLVRRLFQTDQIQRIVQTIRDTLIFVLNLHLETAEDPAEACTPANIKLKARLLQQLSSASRTLHLVFFQTSVRERMEIIARDRKRIKIKLLAMNVKKSPRLVV